MSRFNTKSVGTKTTNLAGGHAYSQTPELALLSILLTSFANDQFYRTADATFENIKRLVLDCNKKFVAKAAIYARTEFGMRSITHVCASELAKYISGEEWAKEFYDRIVYRPDDMLEIASYHSEKNGKMTKAMQKGFAKAFSRFSKYELAKYRGSNKEFKLVDLLNLVHPTPTESNREALEQLAKNELKSFDTWEKELTQAGQQATNEEEKAEFKKAVWIKLIQEKKIGYFALLRNLRNIIEQAPEVINEAILLLTNETLIKKSLVLPFRFTTAFGEIQKLQQGDIIRKVMVALNKAVDIAVNNVPRFDGDTLVVLDRSGSMKGKPAEIGALFAAVLIKANNADFMHFATDAQYVNVNPNDSTITIADSIRFSGGGTNFHSIFKRANRKYDRVIILSDMQGWMGTNTPSESWGAYRTKFGCNPYIYSFDLQGYGSMQFPYEKVFAIAGFSEKIFTIMQLMEQDKQALINKINEISL